MTEANPPPRRKRILLGQLGARGDCLYATAIARQIKHDHPDCHLTWAIGSMASSLLFGNPYVDRVWEFPMENHSDMATAWAKFEFEAFAAKRRGDFDEIYLTQIYPNNFQNFDGTVRYSIFRGYPGPITVPVAPLIYLNPDEIENVARFSHQHKLDQSAVVVMFECTANSGQSFVTPDLALRFSSIFLERFPEARVVLSSNAQIPTGNERIVDGSTLSFRENAELTKYCTLLIGGSSGISWLCTSTWAKPLPMIQLLKGSSSVFASFTHDYEYRGADTSQIIEMTECSAEKLFRCVETILEAGFEISRRKFHENISLNFKYYYFGVIRDLLFERKVATVLGSIKNTFHRYGLKAIVTWPLFVVIVSWMRWLISRQVKKFFTRK